MADTNMTARAKLVLAALIKHSNSDGLCYPSIETVARGCGFSRPTAKRAINELVRRGVVESKPRRHPDGDFDSTLYRLKLGGRVTAEPTSVQSCTDSRVTADPRGRVTGDPENSSNGTRPLNPLRVAASRRHLRSSSMAAGEDGFQEYWAIYPARDGRKRGKAEALKQWSKLFSADRAAAIADVRDRLEHDEQWRRGFPPDAQRHLCRRSWVNDEKVNPKDAEIRSVTLADRQRELEEENRKAGYRAT
jgi:hypothetical protein